MAAYDEVNKADFARQTLSIKDALKKIEEHLNHFLTKPTEKVLAELSGCSVGCIRKRAREDAKKQNHLNPHRAGNDLIPEEGKDIFIRGWPLDDLRRLQLAWKSRKSRHLGKRPNVLTDQPVDTKASIIQDLEQRVTRYMRENKKLLYDLSEERVKNNNIENSYRLINKTLHALEVENSELKAELLLWKTGKLRRIVQQDGVG